MKTRDDWALDRVAAVPDPDEGCEAAELAVKVIASGVGGWQYIDVVSARAGKLESLDYVRQDFGVVGPSLGDTSCFKKKKKKNRMKRFFRPFFFFFS